MLSRGRGARTATGAGLLAACVATIATLGGGTSSAQPAGDLLGRSTLDQTIRLTGDRTRGFTPLEPAPGEGHVVREDGLGTAQAGRASRRRSLLYFGQLSDFQLADEENPARVEFSDIFGGLVSAAWRPQEALLPHIADAAVRQLNAFERQSPVAQAGGRRARMALTLATGDSADNQARNEVQQVVGLLEGGEVNPGSGSTNRADYTGLGCGLAPGPEEAPRYTGVQDYGDYVESPAFYDPDRPVGAWASWPRYPGLMDRAQVPFTAEGSRVPSYVAFGNHDALAQGNQAANGPIEAVALGCVKPLVPLEPNLSSPLSSLDPTYLTGLLGTDPSKVILVPPDPGRAYVSKPQYKALHATGVQADAHGFGFVDPDEERASRGAAGYYAWDPMPGIRFIGLDTVCDGGVAGPSADGNVDHPQFLWLERELRAATEADKLIVVFSHHAIQSLTCVPSDELAPPCTGQDQHGHDRNPGCDLDPRSSSPIHRAQDMIDLLHRYPHAVALISGHSHVNKITPFPANGGGFWNVLAAAEADAPQQPRLLEVMDNRDGTLSLFSTIVDHAAPVAIPASGTEAGNLGPLDLAAIGRTLSFNDSQVDIEDALGEPIDRNAELIVKDPRRDPSRYAPREEARLPRLRLRVRPARVRAGRRTTFRFEVFTTARRLRTPVAGARIRFAGRRARTDRRGRARIAVRIPRAGRRAAHAFAAGHQRGRVTVRVLRGR